MRRYDVTASTEALAFRKSAQVFLVYIGMAVLALGICWISKPGPPGRETAAQKSEYGDALGQSFARLLFGVVVPALCAGVILYAGYKLVRGGDRFVLDRRKNLLTRNGRPLCPLDRIHRVVFRVGFTPTERRNGEGDSGSVILELALEDGREIRVDHARDEAVVSELAQHIASFLRVPLSPT